MVDKIEPTFWIFADSSTPVLRIEASLTGTVNVSGVDEVEPS